VQVKLVTRCWTRRLSLESILETKEGTSSSEPALPGRHSQEYRAAASAVRKYAFEIVHRSISSQRSSTAGISPKDQCYQIDQNRDHDQN